METNLGFFFSKMSHSYKQTNRVYDNCTLSPGPGTSYLR